MRIAEASAHTGLSIDTLRYYEKAGLISPRRQSGQRVYSETDLDELDSIRRLRALGISISEIRTLLAIDRTVGDMTVLSANEVDSLADVLAILREHSTRLESRITSMRAVLASFHAMTSKLTGLLESGGLGNELEHRTDGGNIDLRRTLNDRGSL